MFMSRKQACTHTAFWSFLIWSAAAFAAFDRGSMVQINTIDGYEVYAKEQNICAAEKKNRRVVFFTSESRADLDNPSAKARIPDLLNSVFGRCREDINDVDVVFYNERINKVVFRAFLDSRCDWEFSKIGKPRKIGAKRLAFSKKVGVEVYVPVIEQCGQPIACPTPYSVTLRTKSFDPYIEKNIERFKPISHPLEEFIKKLGHVVSSQCPEVQAMTITGEAVVPDVKKVDYRNHATTEIIFEDVEVTEKSGWEFPNPIHLIEKAKAAVNAEPENIDFLNYYAQFLDYPRANFKDEGFNPEIDRNQLPKSERPGPSVNYKQIAFRPWRWRPRYYGHYPTTGQVIGGMIGNSIGNMLAVGAELRREQEELTFRVHSTRMMWRKCGLVCDVAPDVNADHIQSMFSRELLLKDVTIAINENSPGAIERASGVSSGGGMQSMARLMKLFRGEIDEGILPHCKTEFKKWSRCVGIDNRKQQLEKCAKVYEPYQRCRDDYEFDSRPPHPSELDDPTVYLMALHFDKSREKAFHKIALLIAEHGAKVLEAGLLLQQAEKQSPLTASHFNYVYYNRPWREKIDDWSIIDGMATKYMRGMDLLTEYQNSKINYKIDPFKLANPANLGCRNERSDWCLIELLERDDWPGSLAGQLQEARRKILTKDYVRSFASRTHDLNYQMMTYYRDAFENKKKTNTTIMELVDQVKAVTHRWAYSESSVALKKKIDQCVKWDNNGVPEQPRGVLSSYSKCIQSAYSSASRSIKYLQNRYAKRVLRAYGISMSYAN